MKAIKLHPEAEAELKQSVEFYRQRAGDRWADRFKKCIEKSLEEMGTNPERHRPEKELPGVQKVLIKQFPFTLLYINTPKYVWIVAVAHASRRPGYWINRLS